MLPSRSSADTSQPVKHTHDTRYRVLLADAGGTSRFEHMRVAQRVAHVNVVLLTLILIGVLVFLGETAMSRSHLP